jgi:hypothetical protein
MSYKRKVASFAGVAALCLILGSGISAKGLPLQAPAAAGQDPCSGKQPYTMAEYNAEQAAAAEKNPSQQVKMLDDFVSKYPNSCLLLYVYPLYYQSYQQLKTWPKVIEYVDKLDALGDKVDAPTRFPALNARAVAFTSMSATEQPQYAKSAQEAAVKALKALAEIKKPDNVAQADFDKSKEPYIIFLNGTGAQASVVLKDWQSAINFYKAVLAVKPDEPVTLYSLGRAYLALTPPQTMDGFWYVARGAASKSATQTQAKQLKDYLRKLISNYQQAACDYLTDAELNELLQLASGTAERPASYSLPSSADLDAARKDMTIASVVADLKAGGDKAKVTWLAACGLEFPGVPSKVIEVVPGASETDPIVFKLAFVTSDAEFDAATTPNMDLKVIGQPQAKRVEKDSAIHFTGTLVSYDPDPAFMLHWDKGKINEEDIPKEKAPPKRPTRKRPSGH